jgi:hypothetical protein
MLETDSETTKTTGRVKATAYDPACLPSMPAGYPKVSLSYIYRLCSCCHLNSADQANSTTRYMAQKGTPPPHTHTCLPSMPTGTPAAAAAVLMGPPPCSYFLHTTSCL